MEQAKLKTRLGMRVHYPKKKGVLQSLLGGEQDAAAAARWAVWHLLREEIAATWRRLEHEPGLAAAVLGP